MTLHSALPRLACTLLLVATGIARAGNEHAITLYDEPPRYPSTFTHFDYVNPDAPKGGTFRQAAIGGFDSLNPYITKGIPADGLGQLYDTLAVQGLDEPMTEYGLVASRIEKAPDHTWVRFYLRPEARFHDGHPLRAEDVAFSFTALTTQGAPFYRTYYADVAQVVVENPLQVLFKFKSNGNRELPLILGQLPILPKHYWEGRDFERGNLDIPLGGGPYRIASVQAGRSIRYERVKDYWAKDLPVNRGQYNFDALVYDYYRDSTVALEGLKAGQFDYWQEMIAKNWATAYDVPAVKEGRLVREELPNGSPTGMQGFVFNQRRPLFTDIRVRRALALMLDFQWTNKQLFNGAYKRNTSFFENSEMAAKGLPDAAELKLLEPLRGQVPAEVFTQPWENPVTDGSGMIREQQREAYRLLQEAGWHIQDDRMLDAQGQPAVIEFLVAQPDFERILLPYKRNLKDLGIDLVLRRVDMSQYVNRLRSRDFDMIVASFPQSASPGNEQRGYWSSAAADNPGSRNFMGLKDPAVDTLVDGLINADSRASLVTHAKALDRVLSWNAILIPNWHLDTWRVAYWNRFGHPARPPRYDIGLNTWWAKPAAEAH
ncbi:MULTISPECIES: extracellular solute-binding protein [Pseudomonas]|uniref:ABC transporter substrate-binding protein n=1 Tax=Pseudomonas quercus TaxID=2722792 RepID=A0ABX0YKG4_9PSED|nr:MULTISPECIES: extracellular solute-binding protein [Pseudomonas]MBF7144924.1 ABC transporter substrate-binding protein [Pseudomonas sp. LY10J]NJP03516.1 ABC transporter substrate-binding protein [Pseudomonas quercus]